MLVAHADWSVDARKRWIAIACRGADGWRVAAPAPVGETGTLLARLRSAADGAPVALGLDLPIGLPRAYAERHAVQAAADFPAFLRGLTDRPGFFQVAASLAEIGPDRPFYPLRWQPRVIEPQRALIAALGLDNRAALLRCCDKATPDRPAASPLFWTLGAKQVGKAALHAWRDLLVPALASDTPPRLWPFDGPLVRLLAPGAVAVAETYPAEALGQLGLKLNGSKRRQANRAALGGQLMDRMAALSAAPDRALAAVIADGFGADPAGEDRMDSLLGLLGMLNVLAGNRPDCAPADPWIQRWEGWILGQTASPTDTARPSAPAPSPG